MSAPLVPTIVDALDAPAGRAEIVIRAPINFSNPADLATVAALLAAGTSQPLSAVLTALAAGSAFVKFTGPTSTVKTFTLSDRDDVIMTTSVYDAASTGYISGKPGSGASGGILFMDATDTATGGNVVTNAFGAFAGGALVASASTGGAGGSLFIGAGVGAPGGNIIAQGGSASGATGGNLDMRGTDLPGGSINTSNGGGSLDTTGVGSLELGAVGTRTTLVGAATSDISLSLPVVSGTLATTAYVVTAIAGKQASSAVLTALAGGSQYVEFTGPTSTLKTFTLPDGNATLARTDAAQTFTGKQTITGFNTSDSQLRVGSLEFQPFDIGNAFFGPNVFYNGSNFVYRANGYAGLFYFFYDNVSPLMSGQFRLYSAGTAGAAVADSSVCQMKINSDGEFGIGPSLSTTTANFTAAKFHVSATGNTTVQRLNIATIPTSSSGLVSGDVWSNSGVLAIVP